MQSIKKRVRISLFLSFVFYLIWLLYDVAVYLNINNDNLILLTILCILVSTPFFLFSTFFIKNDYKIWTDEICIYFYHHFWVHIIVFLITVIISSTSFTISLFVSFIVKGIAMIFTCNLVKKIYRATLDLTNVSENKRIELDFQNAIVFGVSALILASLTFGVVLLGGRNVITLFAITMPLALTVFCNYYKLKLINNYKIIEFIKTFILDNSFIVIAMVFLFFFSDSNMFDLKVAEKHSTLNVFVLLPACFLLIPMIKTNKKIGFKLNEIKQDER